MSDLTIIIPAAGMSTRMRGRDKLLMAVDGQPLLRRQASFAAATGCPVTVVVPQANTPRHKALHDLGVRILEVADPRLGMGASIAAAARATPPGRLLILPADMPGLTTPMLQTFIEDASVAPDKVWRAMDAQGTPGHPVLFPVRLFDALGHLTGDQGARDLLRDEQVMLAGLPGNAATLDLDTPEAWAAFRETQP